jgi:hypothetical protein
MGEHRNRRSFADPDDADVLGAENRYAQVGQPVFHGNGGKESGATATQNKQVLNHGSIPRAKADYEALNPVPKPVSTSFRSFLNLCQRIFIFLKAAY